MEFQDTVNQEWQTEEDWGRLDWGKSMVNKKRAEDQAAVQDAVKNVPCGSIFGDALGVDGT